MANNFSFTADGINELGIFPQAFYGPVVPKYESQFLLPAIAESIIYYVPNTEVLPEELLAAKLISQGNYAYGETDVKKKIKQEVVQQSTELILRILNDGGFYVQDPESAKLVLNDLEFALDLVKKLEQTIMDRASEIGIDAAEQEAYVFQDGDFLDVIQNITETE